MIMLCPRNACSTRLGPCYWEKSPQIFPYRGQCCGWAGPCGSCDGHRVHFSKILSGKFEEQDLLSTNPEGYTACLKTTQGGGWVGGEKGWEGGGGAGRVRERENEPGALHLFGSKSKVIRISLGHSLLTDLKHKRRNEHTGAWKWGHSSSRLPMSPRTFWKGNFMEWVV